MTYNVTASLGRLFGICVSPLSEQSTTTPELEHEHCEGQARLPPIITKANPGNTKNKSFNRLISEIFTAR